MKQITVTKIVDVNGGGFSQGFCAGVAGAIALVTYVPAAQAVVAASGVGAAIFLGSVGYCAGYAAGWW